MKNTVFLIAVIMVLLLSSCTLQKNKAKESVTYVPIEEIKIEEAKAKLNKSEAIVVIVNETRLVQIQPEASDPDKDQLAFAYSFPLDKDGKWQTTYGDAGEYTVTLTASDGELSVSKDILIIVNKKEEAPQIDAFAPDEKTVKAQENAMLPFAVNASDLNKDSLSFEWKLDGQSVSKKDSFVYNISFDDAGSHTVKLAISDGVLETDFLWSVTVENVNRKAIIEPIKDIRIKETEKVSINAMASDPDDDTLSITIGEPVGDDGVWETTYDDAGDYTVKVTASDGVDQVSQDVKVSVENVNRAPVILGVKQE
ncbi:MAG TPA: hypothetical protein VJI46_05620 [Candidatus Nanoarchaeia archaeon]|nr:hypothetical protein [Candidatus Nanoarchaeia archaeon]